MVTGKMFLSVVAKLVECRPHLLETTLTTYGELAWKKKKLTQWEAELKDEKKENNSGTSIPFLKSGLATSVTINLWVIFS